MKWLLLLLVLGGLGYFAYGMYTSQIGAREAKSCAQIATICGQEFKPEGREKCERSLAEMRQVSGDEVADRAVRCIAESTTCPSAMGCVAGVGISKAVDVGKDFFQGMMKSITQ